MRACMLLVALLLSLAGGINCTEGVIVNVDIQTNVTIADYQCMKDQGIDIVFLNFTQSFCKATNLQEILDRLLQGTRILEIKLMVPQCVLPRSYNTFYNARANYRLAPEVWLNMEDDQPFQNITRRYRWGRTTYSARYFIGPKNANLLTEGYKWTKDRFMYRGKTSTKDFNDFESLGYNTMYPVYPRWKLYEGSAMICKFTVARTWTSILTAP